MKKKKLNRIKIAIVILVIIIITLFIIINQLPKNNEVEYEMPSQITSIEDLLKYYNCTNIMITESKENGFEYDIYLKFGEDTWKENGNSNEAYYTSIIVNVANLLNYNSYRMIDSERKLLITIIANNAERKIQKTYINGQIDYFSRELTKKIADTYKEVKEIDMKIQAKEINALINNNWEPIQLGTIESRFEDYDIYFDEGIEVKTIDGKVYNIIFTEKYKETILNGLRVNDTKEKITNALGKPSFSDPSVIGYKGKDIYVFFSENEISVYRVQTFEDMKDFLNLWNTFLNEKDVKSFVNKVTDIWPGYSEFLYDSNFVYLKYTLKGIVIQFNVTTENGIVLYNNFQGTIGNELTLKDINPENIPKNIYLHTDEDLVETEEINRIRSKNIHENR
ncbi:MAG: hypothetical protein IKP28_02360 [Clostridia bacterium]|nr:hypothetical protein [Clostridia bacterium]